MLLADGVFSDQDLQDTVALLNAAEVDAQGHFTMFTLNTQQGLTVVLLMDAPGPIPGPSVAAGVETVLEGPGDLLVNYEAGGWWYEYNLPEGLMGTGTLQWTHGMDCVALAWTGLQAGSMASLSIFDVGGIQDNLNTPVLQILDAAGGWGVVETMHFDQEDRIDLSFEVVEIPAAPAWMAMLICMGSRRRRRRLRIAQS